MKYVHSKNREMIFQILAREGYVLPPATRRAVRILEKRGLIAATPNGLSATPAWQAARAFALDLCPNCDQPRKDATVQRLTCNKWINDSQYANGTNVAAGHLCGQALCSRSASKAPGGFISCGKH